MPFATTPINDTAGPQVSICLPVYNGAKYLANSIQSAISQSFSDFELLIADDCSSDDTRQIAADFAKKDSRIKFWTNDTNLGHYGNYNACLNKATGKFIKLFAQDDLLAPDLLKKMVDVFENNPDISLISCARKWIDAKGQEILPVLDIEKRLTSPFAKDTSISGKQAIVSTLTEQVNWLGEPSNQMFRRSHLGSGFDETFRQLGDFEYNCRLLAQGNYYFMAEKLCQFRKHLDSWTTVNSKRLNTNLEWLIVAEKNRKYLSEAGISAEAYCLNFIKKWTHDLEASLFASDRIRINEIQKVLSDLCEGADPLSFFAYEKDSKRNVPFEYRALSAMALLQGVILENELRHVHAEAARPYFEPFIMANGNLEPRADLMIALRSMKQTLVEKDEEIASLKRALDEMGNSVSWKMTAPLRMLKGQWQ
jgi:glycosyltransferase involved in cell wall biosynthesis